MVENNDNFFNRFNHAQRFLMPTKCSSQHNKKITHGRKFEQSKWLWNIVSSTGRQEETFFVILTLIRETW